MRATCVSLVLFLVACQSDGATQDGDSAQDDQVTYLFVQSSASATVADGILTLRGVAPTTLYFTDRPERLTGHCETDSLIEALKAETGPDSFWQDPPNATLSILDDEAITNAVLVLERPTVNGDTIVFPVRVLDGEPRLEGGPVSLFIATIGRPMTSVSSAGHHRRVRRRHIRHAVHR